MNKKQTNKKKSRNSKTLRALTQVTQIGFTVAASILIGVLLGKFLDGLFGTSPWLLLVFSLLGTGSAMKMLFTLSGK